MAGDGTLGVETGEPELVRAAAAPAAPPAPPAAEAARSTFRQSSTMSMAWFLFPFMTFATVPAALLSTLIPVSLLSRRYDQPRRARSERSRRSIWP